MKSMKDTTHSFIVRVWLERRELVGKKPNWRGVIEHIPTGERRGLKNLFDITSFVQKYLQLLGVNSPRTSELLHRIKVWQSNILNRH